MESQEWRILAPLRLQKQKETFQPELPSATPWIIINNFSLRTVQLYAHILHRMICLWYRGAEHDRDFCMNYFIFLIYPFKTIFLFVFQRFSYFY